MIKENENITKYTCKFKDGYYCKLSGVKPTGSIRGDIIGPRYCIQPIPAEHKRGVVCNEKKLVKVKEETLVT